MTINRLLQVITFYFTLRYEKSLWFILTNEFTVIVSASGHPSGRRQISVEGIFNSYRGVGWSWAWLWTDEWSVSSVGPHIMTIEFTSRPAFCHSSTAVVKLFNKNITLGFWSLVNLIMFKLDLDRSVLLAYGLAVIFLYILCQSLYIKFWLPSFYSKSCHILFQFCNATGDIQMSWREEQGWSASDTICTSGWSDNQHGRHGFVWGCSCNLHSSIKWNDTKCSSNCGNEVSPCLVEIRNLKWFHAAYMRNRYCRRQVEIWSDCHGFPDLFKICGHSRW